MGLDLQLKKKKISATIRSCSQEGGEKNEMGNKRNMGGDGN